MPASNDETGTQNPRRPRVVRFGKYEIALPASRILRVVVGVLLVLSGLLGFLPVLGFWMVPLGVIVLSVDFPAMRLLRRKGAAMARRIWNRQEGADG